MNAKKIILNVFFFSLFFHVLPFNMEAGTHFPSSITRQQTKKKPSKDVRAILLLSKVGRTSFHFPEIELYQSQYGLTAFLFDNDKELTVQIIGKDGTVYYDNVIDSMQSEWELNTDFLPSDGEYAIVFILPSGGYLFGEFGM